MPCIFQNKLKILGLSLAFAIMGIVSFISYNNAIQIIESDDKIRHTHEVQKTLNEIFVNLIDAESEKRCYIFYKDEELEHYHIAIQNIQNIKSKINKLRLLMANKNEQKHRLAKLEALISERIDLFQKIEYFRAAQKEDYLKSPLFFELKKNQQQIRNIIAEIQKEEQQLLDKWVGEYESSIQSRMLIEVLGTVLTFAIILGVYALLYQQMVKRQRAETLQRTLSQEKELSELKLRFFSMVSHEFRTPLSIILGSSQLLAESGQHCPEEKKRKNLHRIQSSAKLMTQLLTDILTLTRAEAGKLECHPEAIDLESFCLNLVEDIQVSSNQRNRINLVMKGGYRRAYLDEKLLYSILGNLLANALKYSPEDKKVDFLICAESEAVIFQIKDKGSGISQEDQQKLYEPFHRGSNVGNITGTGLGLAVVKKCVELHGGEISVESALGVGTTFTVKIPQVGAGG